MVFFVLGASLVLIAAAIIRGLLLNKQHKKVAEEKDIKLKYLFFRGQRYIYPILVAVVFFLVIFFMISRTTAIFFAAGAVVSLICCMFGRMIISMIRNNTELPEKHSEIPFKYGVSAGMFFIGTGILLLTICFLIFSLSQIINSIVGFALGVSVIILFTIADNQDFSTAADIFDSCIAALVSAIMLSSVAVDEAGVNATFTSRKAAFYPLVIVTVGALASLIVSFIIRQRGRSDVRVRVTRGVYFVFAVVVVSAVLAGSLYLDNLSYAWGITSGVAICLLTGITIGHLIIKKRTERPELKEIYLQKEVVYRMGTGMIATLLPIVFIIIALFIAYRFAGFFGIANAAVGALSALILFIGSDFHEKYIHNPVTGDVRHDQVDLSERSRFNLLSSTSVSSGSVCAAVITSISLYLAYCCSAELKSVDLMVSNVFIGLLTGATYPFIFTALMFIQGHRENGKNRVNDPKQILIPGITAILLPAAVGLLLGAEALGAAIFCASCAGLVLVVMMAINRDVLYSVPISSINLMIKLTVLVSIVLAPLFGEGIL